ncbi:MAG: hypothetical protein JO115_06115 [Pseudonocardiales bacterium]|nr:hypothetical protein [Pseudonocardiales bacterium]
MRQVLKSKGGYEPAHDTRCAAVGDGHLDIDLGDQLLGGGQHDSGDLIEPLDVVEKRRSWHRCGR